MLAAVNDLANGPERATSELTATCSGRRLWADHLPACAVQVAGSARFAAVALLDGSLQASTPKVNPLTSLRDPSPVQPPMAQLPVVVAFACSLHSPKYWLCNSPLSMTRQ